MSYTRQYLPFTTNGVSFEDGAAVVLNLTISQTATVPLTITPTTIYRQDAQPASQKTGAVTQSVVVNSAFAISSNNYSISPVYDQHPETEITSVNSTYDPDNKNPYTYFVTSVNYFFDTPASYAAGSSWDSSVQNIIQNPSLKSDVVARSTSIAYLSRNISYVWGSTNINIRPIVPFLCNDSTTVKYASTQPQNINLFVESKEGGKYAALRGTNGLYLHCLPASGNITDYVPQDNTIPANCVLTFSNQSSALYSAQWAIYQLTTSDSIVLYNRTAQVCIGAVSSFTSSAAVTKTLVGIHQGSDSNRDSSQLFTPRNPRTETYWYDCYYEQVYRMVPYSLEDAVKSSNCIITVTKPTPNTIGNPAGISDCTAITAVSNPIHATCVSAGASDGGVAAAITTYCSSGNNACGPVCTSWATNQAALASSYMSTYCKNFPNDESLCACINTSQYQGIRDYLALQGLSFLPECQINNCSNKIISYRPLSSANTSCQYNVCIAGLDITAGGNVNIKGYTTECTQGSSSNLNSDGTTATPVPATTPVTSTPNTTSEVLQLVQSIDSKTIIISSLVAIFFVGIIAVLIPQISSRFYFIIFLLVGITVAVLTLLQK